MNVAFSALLIALLILPGAIFRYGYARGAWGWTSPVSFRNVSDELAYSAVFAVGLHLTWNGIASLFGYSTDFASLVVLLSGNFGDNGERYEVAIQSIAGHPAAIGLYFLSLTLVASILGRMAHAAVRQFQWDLQTQIFRFKNEWYYLLTGEALSFKEVSIEPREVDGVYLSAVVDHSKDSYLYRGIVEDWTFNADGSLATISLSNAHRRLLSDDKRSPHTELPGEPIEPDSRYYKIHGDLFVLKYAEIKTLNLDYFALSDEGPRNTPVALRGVGGTIINDD
jgi:hypothetical protein